MTAQCCRAYDATAGDLCARQAVTIDPLSGTPVCAAQTGPWREVEARGRRAVEFLDERSPPGRRWIWGRRARE